MIVGGLLIFILVAGMALVHVYLEPALRKRLHVMIIEGSDSLYTYKLGNLTASALGGNITVENLRVQVDSTRFKYLQSRHALPALTVQVNVKSADVKGISIYSLIFKKQIEIKQIASSNAELRLIRTADDTAEVRISPPIWKSIQPVISSIKVHDIQLDAVKMLYKAADTSESLKLQFDRFDAHVQNLQIDSIAQLDTTRVGYASELLLKFHDMKFRTSDSSYKMKAEWITYNSKTRSVEIDSFKLQPTLKEVSQFYAYYQHQASMYYFEAQKIRLANFPLESFIYKNSFEADSVVLTKARIRVYSDKTQERVFSSRIGSYPHQKLMSAARQINLKAILLHDGQVVYTEKNRNTQMEGSLVIDALDMQIANVTNMKHYIAKTKVAKLVAKAKVFGTSSLDLSINFNLDSTDGSFESQGSIRNVSAAQLNTISIPLANTEIASLQLDELRFAISAEEMTTWTDVQMRYSGLAVRIRQIDKETGEIEQMNFLNKVMNRHVIVPQNPWNGVERIATRVRFMRLTTQTFFGVLWKSIFAGMQQVMMRT
jgi:hypothetical protein